MVDGPAAITFGVRLEELRELMEHRGREAYELIQNKYGGVLEMCKKLYTSPNEGEFSFVTLQVSNSSRM